MNHSLIKIFPNPHTGESIYMSKKVSLKRLTKEQASELISQLIQPCTPYGGNWLNIETGSGNSKIYFSQTKPSSASKGHWNYDFFHTLSFETVQEICRESSCLVLLNYVDKTYTILDGADLLWLARYSSRDKSNDGAVIDIVINKFEDGSSRLTPYDRLSNKSKQVEVKSWMN